MSDALAFLDGPKAADDADPVTAAAAARLRETLPGAIVEESPSGRHPWLRIAPERLVDVAIRLRDDPTLAYTTCHLVSGIDWPAKTPAEGAGSMEAVYHLVSYARRSDPAYRARALKNDPFLVLRVRVPRDRPEVPSVMGVWPGADWHERETYDLLGIRFTGRPALRRILLPEDWPGHPLRKDWEWPVEYHGIPIIPPEGR
jgi:NADH-quinone oxidoreductase subunit C